VKEVKGGEVRAARLGEGSEVMEIQKKTEVRREEVK
jgi:hypothetical protein